MDTVVTKLKLIYLPFLITAACVIGGYTYLNYWLIIRGGYVNWDESVVDIFIPMALPWLPIYFWLWPRIKLLDLTVKGKDKSFGYALIAGLAIFATTAVTQDYMLTATGKLTTLRTVDDIGTQPKTKYYCLQSHFVNKLITYTYFTTSRTNKGRDIDLDYYLVSPIIAHLVPGDTVLYNFRKQHVHGMFVTLINGKHAGSDTINRINPDVLKSITVLPAAIARKTYRDTALDGALIITSNPADSLPLHNHKLSLRWLGTHYHNQISNSTDKALNVSREDQFVADSRDQYQNRDIDAFNYLDRLGKNDRHDQYTVALQEAPFFDQLHDPIIFEAKTGNFADRNGNESAWIFGSFVVGAGIWWLMISFASFNENKLNEFLNRERVI